MASEPFWRAAIDHVFDGTHFAATKEPGSHANVRRTCTLIKYFEKRWSNNDVASSVMANWCGSVYRMQASDLNANSSLLLRAHSHTYSWDQAHDLWPFKNCLWLLVSLHVTVIKLCCDCVTFLKNTEQDGWPHPHHNYIQGHSPSCSSKHSAYWSDPL